MPYAPHTAEDEARMLSALGVASARDLFDDIPQAMRPKSFDLPPGRSEMEVLATLKQLAARNRADVVSFLGGGYYDHHIPAAVDALASRGEFFTAYTPYQPEASQGTLQAIFEYQTAVARLTEMDCANASVYDGGSAIFEAMMMAVRATKKEKLVVDEALSPIHRKMLASYTANLKLELVTVGQRDGVSDMAGLKAAVDSDTAAVAVQNPNFFGSLADYTELFEHAHGHKALGILSFNPVMQAVVKTPGAMGADIAVAEGQSLGQPLSFGGPYLGVMCCAKKLVRQMPGRIVGRTEDADGTPGYVLTLQAREQHIRRAKATSNICSNQALCALRALVHLCLLGPQGLVRTAELSMERAHYAAERITQWPCFERLNEAPFGLEFAVRLPMNAFDAVDALAPRGIVPGLPLGKYYPGMDDVLLVACTEKRSFEEIGILAEMLGGLCR